MSVRRIRIGELIAFVGSACLIVSLLRPWYEGPSGQLNAWNSFGPAVVLLLIALLAGVAVVLSALTERSAALPVAVDVWSVPLGLIGLIAALVRLLERPQHSSSLCAGPWFALAGAWLSLRDERPSLYPPAMPEPRPRP
jgi:uncharacterized membrane protein HdeD (DUF308 family)